MNVGKTITLIRFARRVLRSSSLQRQAICHGIKIKSTQRQVCQCVKRMSLCPISAYVEPKYVLRAFSSKSDFHSDIEVMSDSLCEQLTNDEVILLDVRGKDEIEMFGIIPTAKNIPMDEMDFALNLSEDIFKKKYGFSKPPDDGKNVVFYCQAGVRSLHSLILARSLGMENAKHLAGGYSAWKEYVESKK